MIKQFVSFGFIGTIGFLVDATVLIICNSVFELNLLVSRLISFGIAVTATWYLNRVFTFKEQRRPNLAKEWSQYVMFNGIGALANLAIFMWLVLNYQYFADNPILPLAIASVIAMFINFLASKFIVFNQDKIKYGA